MKEIESRRSSMSKGLLDKRSCQPPFSTRLQDKPFGMVDLQNLKRSEICPPKLNTVIPHLRTF